MKQIRRTTCALLCFVLLSALLPSAGATEPVTPTPPSWCPADEYPIFEGSAAYEPENWAVFQRMRDYVDAGGVRDGAYYTQKLGEDLKVLHNRYYNDRGVGFEIGLIFYGLYLNEGKWDNPIDDSRGEVQFRTCLWGMADNHPNRYLCALWAARTEDDPRTSQAMEILLSCPEYRVEQILSSGRYRLAPAAEAEKLRQEIYVTLADMQLYPNLLYAAGSVTQRQAAQSRNGRTMVQIRSLAEALDMTVAWDAAASRITLTGNGDTISVTLGSTTGTKNGTPLTMDVAPYAEGGRTYLPLRFVSEQLGLGVEWDEAKRLVVLSIPGEDAGGSNLEDWALPMGAMLVRMHRYHVTQFGGRALFTKENGQIVQDHSYGLRLLNGDSWGIMSREELIETVNRMTVSGHNDSFLYDAALVSSLTPAEYQQLLNSAQGMDAYMWPYTKALAEKWGDRGILCWDLFRMSDLVQ